MLLWENRQVVLTEKGKSRVRESASTLYGLQADREICKKAGLDSRTSKKIFQSGLSVKRADLTKLFGAFDLSLAYDIDWLFAVALAPPTPSSPITGSAVGAPVDTYLTLVNTDIEGSSDEWAKYGSEFRRALQQHNKILTETAREFHAVEWDGHVEWNYSGDGFIFAFVQAVEALQFALEIQRRLQDQDWTPYVPGLKRIKVRVGMHTGKIQEWIYDEDKKAFSSPPVNVMARTCAAAHGGQILLSFVTHQEIVGETGKQAYDFIGLGHYHLKGVGEFELFQPLAQGLQRNFPELRAPKSNGTASGADYTWKMPHARNSFFTGRADELDTLRILFTLSDPPPRFQVITGLGGSGKTQTAVEYAYRYREVYTAVYWADAENATLLSRRYAELAVQIGLAGAELKPDLQVKAFRDMLESDEGRNTLLILDNADEPEALADLVPAAPYGHILVTSRAPMQHFAKLHVSRNIDLKLLSESDARTFLLRRTARLDSSKEERYFADAITERLGRLPLALEQAAAYMAQPQGTSFEEYLSFLDEDAITTIEEMKPQTGPYPASVATTWNINIQKIPPAAAEILNLAAFLAPDRIPRDLILGGAEVFCPALAAELDAARSEPRKLQVYNRWVQPLTRYSLVQIDVHPPAFSIHRLVQEVLLHQMESAKAERLQMALATIALVFTAHLHHKPSLCSALWPHIDALYHRFYQPVFDSLQASLVLQTMDSGEKSLQVRVDPDLSATLDVLVDQEREVAADLFLKMGRSLVQAQLFPSAASYFESSVRLMAWKDGQPASLIIALHAWAEALHMQKKNLEAEALLKFALLCPDVPPVLVMNTFRLLGQALRVQSQQNVRSGFEDNTMYRQAREYMLKAASLGEAHMKPGDMRRCTVYTLLNIFSCELGRLEEARHYLDQADRICSYALEARSIGEDAPARCRMLKEEGILFCQLQQEKLAYAKFEEALKLDTQRDGPMHLATGYDHGELAICAEKFKNYKLAQKHYEAAIAVFLPMYPGEDPLTKYVEGAQRCREQLEGGSQK